MRLAKIDVFQRDLPYAGGVYRLSGGRTYERFDVTVVRVTSDTGLEGWGESTPFGPSYIAAHARGVRAGIEEMAPHLLGRDPRHLDRLNEAMDEALVGHLHAKAPIDIACWDLFGKAVGMPVCDLLGGRTPDRLPTISSLYAGDPDEMRARAQRFREKGYRGHSVKVGADESEGGPMLDAERIKTSLADRQPGEFYIVDCNSGLSVEHVLRMLNLLPSGLDFSLEAPCGTWRECLSLRKRTSVPIIMDELATDDGSIAQVIADDAADGIGLKITKAGGLTRARRQRDMAIAGGLTMSVQDTTGSEIAFAAIAHMGQSVPRKWLNCILDCRDMFTEETAVFDAPVQEGGVKVPDRPGLGITPNLNVLGDPVARYA